MRARLRVLTPQDNGLQVIRSFFASKKAPGGVAFVISPSCPYFLWRLVSLAIASRLLARILAFASWGLASSCLYPLSCVLVVCILAVLLSCHTLVSVSSPSRPRGLAFVFRLFVFLSSNSLPGVLRSCLTFVYWWSCFPLRLRARTLAFASWGSGFLVSPSCP